MANEKKLLNEEALEQITGGAFSAEAQDWISRNKETVYARVESKYGIFSGYAKSKLDSALETYGNDESTVYEVADIKNALRNYLDVDDLT